MPSTTSCWRGLTGQPCQTERVQIFTPNPSRFRGRFGWVLPVILVLGLVVYWRFNQPTAAYLTEMIGLVIVLGGYILLYFRNSRITAEPRSLTIRTAFGISHTVAEHHLAKAVLIENHVTSRAQSAAVSPRLFLLDDEGHSVLRWSGQVWTEDQMRALVSSLDIPLTEIPGTLGSGDIHRRYPHALGLWEGHPVAIAVLFIAALVVVSITVLTGLAGTH
jgi:hypothetical protein